MTDFNRFWKSFPRRTGKLDAMKAYERARKKATAQEILSGVWVYIVNKPEYADWCHPATWLNKGRWMDEYDVPVKAAVDFDWYVQCAKLHGGECGGDRMRHHIRMQIEKAS